MEVSLRAGGVTRRVPSHMNHSSSAVLVKNRPEDLQHIADLIAEGKIKPLVSTRALSEFPKTLAELLEGKVHGRVALLHD